VPCTKSTTFQPSSVARLHTRFGPIHHVLYAIKKHGASWLFWLLRLTNTLTYLLIYLLTYLLTYLFTYLLISPKTGEALVEYICNVTSVVMKFQHRGYGNGSRIMPWLRQVAAPCYGTRGRLDVLCLTPQCCYNTWCQHLSIDKPIWQQNRSTAVTRFYDVKNVDVIGTVARRHVVFIYFRSTGVRFHGADVTQDQTSTASAAQRCRRVRLFCCPIPATDFTPGIYYWFEDNRFTACNQYRFLLK